MGLKPYDRKISQIFNNIKYDIDFYQREYKWNDDLDYKPVSSLLKDIFYRFDLEKYNPNIEITPELIDKLEWYYLNSFMTNSIGGRKYIVDGQQRLTTITLISIALYHLAKSFDLPVHITDTLRSSIRGTTDFGPTYWMGFKDREAAIDDLLNNNFDYSHEPSNVSEKNIYANYKLIFEMLQDKYTTGHKLQTFISYFRNRVFLIEIEVDKDKDVAMVFEVMNDRGVPLKPYEILKGKLLSQIDIADRDKYVDIWERAISTIEEYSESQIDEFFSFYFRSKFADSSEQYRKLEKDRYHKSIFLEDFDMKLGLKNNEVNCRDFIGSDLPYFATLYRKILSFCENYNKEYEHIYFNKLNNIDGQFLLILSAVSRDDPNSNQKMKLVAKLFDRHFVALQLTNSYRSNNFNASIISLNGKVRNKSISEIDSAFQDQLLDDVKKSHGRDDLSTMFNYQFFKRVGYNSSGSKFLRYFFARIDHHISDFSDFPEYGTYYQLVKQTKGNDVYHVEHILANNPKNIDLFEDEEEFNEQRNRLGDLLLLKGKDNQSSGAETFDEKLKTYNVTGTYYARTLLKDIYHNKFKFCQYIKDNDLNFKSYDSFAKNEIEERHKLLYDLSKKIWDL